MARTALWKRLLGQAGASRQPRARGWRRRLNWGASLFLEQLEDRRVLSVFIPNTFLEHGDLGVLPTDVTLRDAVMAANANATALPDTIQLGAGTYQLDIVNGAGQENGAVTGDLDINPIMVHPIIIQGTGTVGPNATKIDQTILDRVFQVVQPGSLVIFKNVVIEGGTAVDNGTSGALPGSTAAWGGGVLNVGNATFQKVLFQGNTAVGADGSTVNNPSLNGQNAAGGGLYSAGGLVNLWGVTFWQNTAQGGDGGLGISLPVGGPGGNGGSGRGGGMYTTGGMANLSWASFSSNLAQGGNGGTGGDASVVGGTGGLGGTGGVGQGGAMYDTDTVTASLLSFNSNAAQGGIGGDGGGGALALVGGAGGIGGDGQGGALYETGAFKLLFASFWKDHAFGGDGGNGAGAATFITGGAGGDAGYGQGGALYDTGTFDVAFASFFNEVAMGGNGGLGGSEGGAAGTGGNGGNGGQGLGGGVSSAGIGKLAWSSFLFNLVQGGNGGNGGSAGAGGTGGNGGNGANAKGNAIDVAAGSLTLSNSLVILNKAKKGLGGIGGSPGGLNGADGSPALGDGGVHVVGGAIFLPILDLIFANTP